MAQNITIMGASYSDVPAVQLPKTGGGTWRMSYHAGRTATSVKRKVYFQDRSAILASPPSPSERSGEGEGGDA